ncbi:hypothetical protein Q9295_04280 [Xinfangfangia sp. CPCC 101601]|uniref:Glycosyltransferase family 1 protein n=1 Tax=Pseudogemmobacter lacusdianii TaxID=3069608 RepID=A0ABU0VVN6_9RHOB|nr:hypothetical protein [Xinfangfangia sp. CPCC 101601]MDQ2065578.1 hypothetical protein [Xinfangfangia sp. CPCC 101601]
MIPPPPVALLASELGGGRGHVSTLAQAGLALGPGVTVIAALGEMRHAAELERLGFATLSCPKLSASAAVKAQPLTRGNATWACYLADCGFMDRAVLQRSLRFWRDLLLQRKVAILIADYAPLAQRAALALREEGHAIRIVTIGTGYGIPPSDLAPLPQLTPDYNRVIHSEASVLESLNAAAAELGMSALPRLSALYAADLALIGTFDVLDPYQRAKAQLSPPVVSRSDILAQGDEVYAYFSREEVEGTALVKALCALSLPKRGYFPAASEAAKARLAASGMVIEEKPISFNMIAQRSRVMLHPAPHGSICTAALAGLPQIGLPGHREQLCHARRAEAAGICKVLPPAAAPEAIIAAIEGVYHDPKALPRAHALARDLRQDFPEHPMAALSHRLAPLVREVLVG